MIEEILAAIRQRIGSSIWDQEAIADAASLAVSQLKSAPPEAQIAFVLRALAILAEGSGGPAAESLRTSVSHILRRKLPFTEEDVIAMVETVHGPRVNFPYRGVLKAAESVPLSPRLSEALRRLKESVDGDWLGQTEAKALFERIDKLIAEPPGNVAGLRLVISNPRLERRGAWSETVLPEIESSPQRLPWTAFFQHCVEIKPGDPAKKWLTAAAARIAGIGLEAFEQAALRWLRLGPSPNRPGVQAASQESDYLRGFVWSLAGVTNAEIVRAIGSFAEECFHKIPQIGAVSQKAGNACVNVLAATAGLEPVAQLSRLAHRVKYDTAQRLIEEALQGAAAREGITRDDLEEMMVPDFGLGPAATRQEDFGDYLALVAVEDTSSVTLSWSDRQGHVLKAAPAHVKERHPAQLDALKRTVKDMEKMLAAHRTRIERLLLTQRAIPAARWRTSYIEHPLLGDMCRRLIWQAGDQLLIWRGEQLTGILGRPVAIQPDTHVRLWHPIQSDVQTVLDWRCWLEDNHVRQPFKQAHREVYFLTDAERATGTYSNRFAAHVLKQHQFHALCQQRSWDFRLMGPFDSHNVPTLDLPQFGLTAEFHVDMPRDQLVSHHGIFACIHTFQVSFRSPEGAAVAVEAVPAIVFSEVMRDVDLFTGVASIGNDPTWTTRDAAGPFNAYWHDFAFGDLPESAHIRHDVLSRLLPKLEIRGRCRLEERFLVVQGERATYRIHLGSGGVLMEPGSRYLCIVQDFSSRKTAALLPFEGDHALAVILSKAFLLAADRKITDPTILSQLPS